MALDGKGRPVLSDAVAEAFKFALDRHRGQYRKGTPVPYVAHLMQVSGHVLEHAAPEDAEVCAIAALLHDVVEDQDVALEEIEARFGAVVARIVHGCTKPERDEIPDWLARNVAYLRRLRQEEDRVVLVSLADKTHNGWCMVRDAEAAAKQGQLDRFFARFNAGAACQRWYYRALLRVYRERNPPKPLLRLFSEAVGRLDVLVREDCARRGVPLECPGEETFPVGS